MKAGVCIYARPNICYGGGGGGGFGNILGDVVDLGTAIFAPEALPIVAPTVGAVTGGLSGGGKGALLGGLEGGVLGQLGGTGPLALGASDTGGSLINQAIGGIGGLLGGGGLGLDATGAGAAGGAGAAAAPSITSAPLPSVLGSGALGDVGGVTIGGGLGAAPVPTAAPTLGGGFGSSLTDFSGAGAGASLPQAITLGGGLGVDPTTGLAATATGSPDLTLGGGLGGTPGLTAGGGAGGAAGGAGANNGGLFSGVGNFLKNNPLLTLGAGFLGSQLLSPKLQQLSGVNQQTPAEKNLLAVNAPATSAADALIPSLQTGQLPPGAQEAVTNALNSDIASIKSRYASLGMSGSSSEQQDIENAKSRSVAQQFTLSQQATQTGLDALGLTQGAYTQLLQDQLTRQQDLSNATSNFFGQLGLGTALAQGKTA